MLTSFRNMICIVYMNVRVVGRGGMAGSTGVPMDIGTPVRSKWGIFWQPSTPTPLCPLHPLPTNTFGTLITVSMMTYERRMIAMPIIEFKMRF